ncbi:MAG: fasciclin domain-containing protein [Bacteroidaceae bacterium]
MKVGQSFFVAIALMTTVFVSCSDNVDESDMYTFTGKTVVDVLKDKPDYSYFVAILNKVRFSDKSQSTAAQLLSSRGNYTVFAPNNNAIQQYLDSINNTTGYDVEQISDSLATSIVRNAIIDSGDNNAFFSTDFLSGVLDRTNLDDRFITVGFEAGENSSVIFLNNKSKVLARDLEASNGVVHTIDRVLDFSNSNLAELIKQTPNLQIFGQLLTLTGWQDSLTLYRDLEYEKLDHGSGFSTSGEVIYAPEHRYIGYTAFVETDSVLALYWQLPEIVYNANGSIANWSQIYKEIKEKCERLYPEARNANPKDEDNAVNKFVAYHLLPMRIRWDQIVQHHCEMGYAYIDPTQLGVDCYEYYETMGKTQRRLMKITEGAQSDGKRINRKVVYDYGPNGDQLNVKSVLRPGVEIYEGNNGYNQQALNGFYYTISEPLVYDDGVPNSVLNERLRWDFSSLLPELITNNFRKIKDSKNHYFPAGYFDRVKMRDECNYKYISYYYATIENYQGDEHNISGQYDFVVALPPVPFRGTYEFRLSVAHYSALGMAQIYIGTSPNNLHACGLPIDLRLDVFGSAIGYQLDGPDWDLNRQNDKEMRNRGYMKPPQHDGIKTPQGTVPVESMRSSVSKGPYARLRYIVYTGTLDPTQHLYMRVKNVLENTAASFELDYLEYAPKSVYAGAEAEDIW